MIKDKTKTQEPGIYLLGDGRYMIQATRRVPGEKTPRVRRRIMDEGTKMSEARIAREELRKELEDQSAAEKTTPNDPLTVGDYAVRWYERKVESLSPTSRRTYLDALDTKILPQLEHLPIKRLNRAKVQEWVSWANAVKTEEGESYARSTRLSWWRVLKQLLLDLKADCGLALDPTERVKPPSADGGWHRETRTMSRAEMRRFLTTARVAVPDRYAEILVLATTGMRSGELYGLQWEDLDYNAQTIHIRRGSSRAGLHDTTKTGHARTVPMLPGLALELRAHHKRLFEQDKPGLLLTELVFPSEVGTVRTASCLHKPLRTVSELIGLDFVVTGHVLRRCFNSILQDNGVPEAVIRTMIGHSSPAMTQLYTGIEMATKIAQLTEIMTDWTCPVEEVSRGGDDTRPITPGAK